MDVQKVCVDVLCVGGGIAGLMAAIEAAEYGAKNVAVVEKAHVNRSGSAGMGNDHFQCYIPEVHGDYDKFAEYLYFGQQAPKMRQIGRSATDYWFKNSFDIVKLWESWGIPMKYKGEYEFAGHVFEGQPVRHLRYEGRDQKKVLTKQAKKRGVQIFNRVMVYDLIRDEKKVVGALGVSTRDDKLYEFESKTVILGTGLGSRMYPGPTLHDFNRAYPATNTGDGRAMAYRAGAELTNMEIPFVHAGPKYFVRCGQATWIGVLRDSHDKAVGIFLDKPQRRYNDMTTVVHKTIFEDYINQGKGPIYMDGRGMSNEDYEYMMHWLENEGNGGLIQHLEDEGIDFRKNPIEFMTYEMTCGHAGIPYNYKGETSMEGLYAAGDEHFGGIPCAAIFGRQAGKYAAKYAERSEAVSIEPYKGNTIFSKDKISDIRKRKDGPGWQEASGALQQVMRDHAGPVRCQDGLEAGLKYINRIKDRAHDRLMAENAHELMLGLSVLNQLDVAELVFLSALHRKETRRPYHIRPDFPLTSPTLEGKNHIMWRGPDGAPIFEWRKPPQ